MSFSLCPHSIHSVSLGILTNTVAKHQGLRQPPELEEAGGILLQSLWRGWALLTPWFQPSETDSRLLTSSTVSVRVDCYSSHPVCGHLLALPQEENSRYKQCHLNTQPHAQGRYSVPVTAGPLCPVDPARSVSKRSNSWSAQTWAPIPACSLSSGREGSFHFVLLGGHLGDLLCVSLCPGVLRIFAGRSLGDCISPPVTCLSVFFTQVSLRMSLPLTHL